MKIVLAQVNGDGIEGNAGYGVEGAVQGIEVQEIVGLLADQDLAYLLAEHLKAQARGAQCIENGILCGPVDFLGGGAVRAHLHHSGRRPAVPAISSMAEATAFAALSHSINRSLPLGRKSLAHPFPKGMPTIKVSHLRSKSFIKCQFAACYHVTIMEGFYLIIGLPTDTFVGVIIVPVAISLLLLIWALRW